MDPFNKVVERDGILACHIIDRLCFNFDVNLPSSEKLKRERLRLEVRMLRISSHKILQAWPSELDFVANGVKIFKVEDKKDGHKRRDLPQSLSDETGALSVGLRSGSNAISLLSKDENIADFAIAIILTKARRFKDISSEVPTISYDVAGERVSTFVVSPKAPGEELNSEVMCLSSDTLRLLCPITMDRVQDPVRGENCQHLQCFGLGAYLQSNHQMRAFNNRWGCPLCSLVLRPADLCRDAYVERVLSQTSAHVSEVVIMADGTWKPVEEASGVRLCPAAAESVIEALAASDDEAPPQGDGDSSDELVVASSSQIVEKMKPSTSVPSSDDEEALLGDICMGLKRANGEGNPEVKKRRT
jgi:hypothetical protein